MNKKNQRIQVFARCRPVNSVERKQCSPSVVEVIPEKKEILLKDRNTNREFFFDKVFPPDATQISVYKSVVAPLIPEVLMGYNCTVFAYGQTGTGKTYTMEGERNNTRCSWEDDPGAGIIPRSLHQLFEELYKEENVEFSVRVSFLELYNEELFDLLSSTELSKLRLFDDRKGSVIIQGLDEIIVNNKDEVYAILEKGTARRQTAATMLNASSSRSHTVFSVTVHIKENTVEGEELLKTGKLNLVDLAGSENVGRSGAIDKRAREAGNINQSLLTLGRVITALIEKQPHIPYRESKLTRLLQDSLGGHTKTSIIATISPALCNFDETISTLDYATKAKSITIRPEVNQKMTKRALIREYTEEIERLRKDLVALRNKDGFFIDADNYATLMNSNTEKQNMIEDYEKKLESLNEDIKKIDDLFKCTKEEKDKISEELNEVTALYKSTMEELERKTYALNCTQKALEKASLERDEKQVVINYQKNTEKKLAQQSQTLLQVVSESTNDVNKLHDKVDRKKTVEKMNDERIQTFRSLHQKQFAHLDDIITEDKNEEIRFLQSLKDDFHNVIGHIVTDMKEVVSQDLNSILSSEQKKMLDFSTHLNNKEEEQKKWANELSQNLKSRNDDQVLKEQEFIEKTLPLLSDALSAATAKVFDKMTAKYKEICQKINEQKIAAEARLEKERILLRKIAEQLESYDAKQQMINDDLSRQTSVNVQALEQQEQLMETFCEAFLKNRKGLEQNFKQQAESLAEAKERRETLLKPAIDTVTEFEKDKEQENVSGYDEVTESIKFEELHLLNQSVRDSHNSVSESIKNVIETSVKNQQENHEELRKGFERHNEILLKQAQNDVTLIKEHTADMSESINRMKEDVEKRSESFRSAFTETIARIDESEQRRKQVSSQIKEEILTVDTTVEKFIYEDLVKDLPTGTTPQRKSFSYPTNLVASSPEDQVLKRYRLKRAVDIAKAVHLPLDSSFDESEESKVSSPDCASSTTVSHNTSAASDDIESIGNESDSNASLSDASVDSLKNKENYSRKKKSRLPKIHSKKLESKVFLKPRVPLNSNIELNLNDS